MTTKQQQPSQPPILKLFTYTFLSWFIPLISAFAFFQPPTDENDKNKPPQLSIEKSTFKVIMVCIGSTTSTFLLTRLLLRSEKNSISPNKLLERIVVEAIPFCSFFLIVNLILDMLILIPMSGQTFADYFMDIGGRYVGTIFSISFFIENLVVSAKEKMELTYNADEDEPGVFSTMFQVLTRVPLIWIAPYVVSSFFYQEHTGDTSPLHLIVSSMLYETFMLNVRVASQLYFFYRAIQHISTPRLKKWGIFVACLFWIINTVLELFVTFPVVKRRSDVKDPQRYVIEMCVCSLTMLVWGIYASYFGWFCEKHGIIPRQGGSSSSSSVGVQEKKKS